MRHFLMCPPDFYGIEYEINPWMNRERPADHADALGQWTELYDTLTSMAGVKVELITPIDGLPDMVFTANAGLVKGEIFIPSRFRFRERQGEEEYYEAWFAEHGYDIERISDDLKFEGAGDVLRAGGTWYGAYYFRSAPRAHAAISEILGEEVVPLRLVDERFYHLDTCFLPIGDSLIYYPQAFDEYSLEVIRDRLPNAIEVDGDEAALFACNSVIVDNWVIVSAGCNRLCGSLAIRDYECISLDMSQFIKAGGSAKCLTLEI
jgi:N-dimethylarginine dimethylaminohydrolase